MFNFFFSGKRKYILGGLFVVIAVVAYMALHNYTYVNRNPMFPSIKNTSFQYKVVDTIQFSLGEYATPYLKSIDFFTDKGRKVFSFYNTYTHQIYLYDYEKQGEPFKKIALSEAVLDTLDKITGYSIYSPDSIFVNGYSNRTIALVNGEGELINVLYWPAMLTESALYPPYLKGWTITPMVYQNGKLVMSGFAFGEVKLNDSSNRPVTVIINTKKKKSYFDGYYPKVYRKGNWGGIHYRKVYAAFNPQKKLWVYSFPASHYVFATHHQKGETYTKHYAGSKQLMSIKSLDYPKGVPVLKSWRMEYYALHNNYGPIFYDPWRKRYYRFAQTKLAAYKGKMYKPFILIILNNNLKYVGEVPLTNLTPYMIYIYGIFVTREGVNLQILNGNEDEITLITLKLLPK